MRVAEVDLAAEIEDLLLGGGELARRLGVGSGFGDGLADLELAAEVVRGGLVALEVQLAGGLERVDVVLERVGQGVVEDGSDPAVDGQFEGLHGELGAVGVVEPSRGHDGGQAHAGVFVADGLIEQGDVVRELPEGVADDVHGGGAGFRLLGLQELGDQLGVGLVMRPGGPKGLAEVVLVGRVLLVELGGPGLDGGQDFCRGVAAEFATGAVAGAVFGLL